MGWVVHVRTTYRPQSSKYPLSLRERVSVCLRKFLSHYLSEGPPRVVHPVFVYEVLGRPNRYTDPHLPFFTTTVEPTRLPSTVNLSRRRVEVPQSTKLLATQVGSRLLVVANTLLVSPGTESTKVLTKQCPGTLISL